MPPPEIPPQDDATQRLARAAGGGDPALLEELFLRVGPALCAWSQIRLHPKVRHQVDPEDLVQEVWLRALDVFPRNFDPDVQSFRGWLFRLAYNVLREVYRKLGPKLGTRAPGTALVEDPEGIPDSITAMSHRLARQEAIRNLAASVQAWDDETDRSLFLLRGIEGLPHDEVAERLGLSAAAARKRWERVRRRLDEVEIADGILVSA